MLTASIIKKYGIVSTWNHYAAIDDLYSGSHNDPELAAENLAHDVGMGNYFDVCVAIGEENKCCVQVLVFRNKAGYDLYKADNIVIFDHKEI